MLKSYFRLQNINFIFDIELRMILNQHLQVVKKTEIPELLNEIYDSPNGLGGIVVFYKYIQTKYINIKRQEVADFLKSKPLYSSSLKLK